MHSYVEIKISARVKIIVEKIIHLVSQTTASVDKCGKLKTEAMVKVLKMMMDELLKMRNGAMQLAICLVRVHRNIRS